MLAHVVGTLMADGWRRCAAVLLVLSAAAFGASHATGARPMRIAAPALLFLAVSIVSIRGARRKAADTALRFGDPWLAADFGSSVVPGLRGTGEARADAAGVHALRRSVYPWDVAVAVSAAVTVAFVLFASGGAGNEILLPSMWSLNVFIACGIPRVRWTRVVVGWEEIRAIDINGGRIAIDAAEGPLLVAVRYSARLEFTEQLREFGGEKVRVAAVPVPKRPRPAPAPPTLDEAAARLAALRRTDPPGAADG